MIATHLDSTALGETGQPQPQAATGTASRYSRTANGAWAGGINLGIPDAVKLAVQVEAVKQ